MLPLNIITPNVPVDEKTWIYHIYSTFTGENILKTLTIRDTHFCIKSLLLYSMPYR